MKLTGAEYQAIVESSPNMIWRAGTDAKCNYFNGTWLKFTGRSQEEEFGDGWVQGVHPDDTAGCFRTYLEAFQRRESFQMKYRLKRFDGQFRWINDRGVPFFHPDGSFAGYIGSCMDITEEVEAEKLVEMAQKDQLTGLNNRNYLMFLLDDVFRNACQTDTSFALLMMDIDRFKRCNDDYGHMFGDKVLQEVAHKLLENIHKADLAGRYGGDEFLVIFPESTVAEVSSIATRILNSLSQATIDGVQMEIGVSIGIAAKTDEVDVHQVIEKADQAMYRAKQAGGRQIFLAEELEEPSKFA